VKAPAGLQGGDCSLDRRAESELTWLFHSCPYGDSSRLADRWRIPRRSSRPPDTHLLPRRRHGSPKEPYAFDRAAGQLRLGGEHHLRNADQLAVLVVWGAPFGQLPSTAEQRMPAAGGTSQGDRHLAQRAIAHGAAVALAGRASAVGCELLIGSLVHDQHPIPVTKVPGPRRSDVQNLLVVPAHVTGSAAASAVRCPAASAIVQFHQQPADHLAGALLPLASPVCRLGLVEDFMSESRLDVIVCQ
jgi:hypothetical protein